MPLQTCIFDLGNVLVFFCHERMFRNMAAVSDVPVETVRQFLIDSGFQAAIETGRVSEEEFHAEFESHIGRNIPIDDLRHAVGDIFDLNADMIPLLEELKSAGIRLVLMSNTCVTHIDYIRSRWSFLDLFDGITTSWETGALKPDPRIYESALAQAKCRPGDCFFTDDIEDYTQQAAAMGIHAEVFRNADTTRQTLRALGVKLAETAS